MAAPPRRASSQRAPEQERELRPHPPVRSTLYVLVALVLPAVLLWCGGVVLLHGWYSSFDEECSIAIGGVVMGDVHTTPMAVLPS